MYERGPRDAQIMIVGDSITYNEQKKGGAFLGESGKFLKEMLRQANIDPDRCFYTTVADCSARGPITNLFVPTAEAKKAKLTPYKGLYPTRDFVKGMVRLGQQILEIRPQLIICLGSYAFWALSENLGTQTSKGYAVPKSVASWRGSQLTLTEGDFSCALMPTHHPSDVMKKYEWHFDVIQDFKRSRRRNGPNWIKFHTPEFIIRPSYEQTVETLSMLIGKLEARPTKISADLETRGGHIACTGLAWSASKAICIPHLCVERPRYFPLAEEFVITRMLQKIFMHPNIRLIGQNFGYDLQYIAKEFFCVPKVSHDTMLTQNLLLPGMPKALHYLSSLYCQHHVYWKDDGKEWNAKVPEEQLWTYNCDDAVRTFEVAERQQEKVMKEDLEEQFKEQHVFFHIALDLMFGGIKIDLRRRAEMGKEVMQAIFERKAWLDKVVNPPPLSKNKTKGHWSNSPTQLQRLFYEVYGISPIFDRKTRRPTIDDKALDKIKRIQPILTRVCEVLQELRSLEKSFSNVISARLDPDDRMRPMYNAAGTETYRWSSGTNAFGNGTNLQNISEGNEG